MHDFDGFTIKLLEDEHGDFVAHFVEMPNISAFGDSPTNAIEELKTAWEETKQSYTEHNESIPIAPSRKEYSGQFNVRIDRRLHRQLALEAIDAGISLNALIAQKLTASTSIKTLNNKQV